MKPTYRYFRRSTGALYKVRTGAPTCSDGNTYSDDGGDTWSPTLFHLADMLSSEGFWGSEPLPVEVNADGEPLNAQPVTSEAPTYRYFRQGCGEWKVQTSDPESHEGNFYRNAETPWLSASQSLTDLLAMGATEVGASVEQVPRWAVAAVFQRQDGAMAQRLEVHQADTGEQAIGLFMADLYKANPGAQVHKPLIERVP